MVQTESICKQQNKCNLKVENFLAMSEKHCGKRKKCWLPGHNFQSIEAINLKVHILIDHIKEKCSVQEP